MFICPKICSICLFIISIATWKNNLTIQLERRYINQWIITKKNGIGEKHWIQNSWNISLTWLPNILFLYEIHFILQLMFIQTFMCLIFFFNILLVLYTHISNTSLSSSSFPREALHFSCFWCIIFHCSTFYLSCIDKYPMHPRTPFFSKADLHSSFSLSFLNYWTTPISTGHGFVDSSIPFIFGLLIPS